MPFVLVKICFFTRSSFSLGGLALGVLVSLKRPGEGVSPYQKTMNLPDPMPIFGVSCWRWRGNWTFKPLSGVSLVANPLFRVLYWNFSYQILMIHRLFYTGSSNVNAELIDVLIATRWNVFSQIWTMPLRPTDSGCVIYSETLNRFGGKRLGGLPLGQPSGLKSRSIALNPHWLAVGGLLVGTTGFSLFCLFDWTGVYWNWAREFFSLLSAAVAKFVNSN
jgi:hypothetical protein